MKEQPVNDKAGDEWETPDDLYAVLDDEFDFNFDAASNGLNAKCPTFSTNSLEQDWYPYGTIWLNPPYSRGKIEPFIKKVVSEYKQGATIVTLTRFDTTTDWFKLIDKYATEVRMLARRVKFKGATSCYNFPCCVSVFGDQYPVINIDKYFIWDWKNAHS